MPYSSGPPTMPKDSSGPVHHNMISVKVAYLSICHAIKPGSCSPKPVAGPWKEFVIIVGRFLVDLNIAGGSAFGSNVLEWSSAVYSDPLAMLCSSVIDSNL